MNRNLLRGALAALIAGGVAVAFLAGRMTAPAPTADMAAEDAAAAGAEHADHDPGAVTAAEPESKAGGGEAGMESLTGGGQEAGMEGMAGAAQPAAGGDPTMPADAVMITPERQQLIGIRTTRVERRSLDRTIRTVGVVGYNERRVAHIHTKVTGWIESLQVDSTGELVEEGQQLLEIYSPQLLSTQEEYLLALRGRASLGDSAFPEVARSAHSLLEATRRRLQLWDIPDEQIMALEETGVPTKTLPIYSPIRGFVIHKGAYEGQHVGPDTLLYTIADLQDVWITADIYEYEIPLVVVGQQAVVTLSYAPGESFRGRVDYIYPYMTGETRTAQARLVFANPGWKLKPGMYANVEITARLGEGLVIPEDAVIDTGIRKVAFRKLPGGHFQPVEIETGFKVGDQVQVLAGLTEGEEIVSGAAFLVDSESKLGSALRAMGHQH